MVFLAKHHINLVDQTHIKFNSFADRPRVYEIAGIFPFELQCPCRRQVLSAAKSAGRI